MVGGLVRGPDRHLRPRAVGDPVLGRSSHRGIDDVDYLIAATAIVVDADLLTTNVRHFPMFPDLQPPY